ncbi:ATP-binding cassette domain-containing protein [Propionimicrobium sp. PCR01-08-3]|uniref:ATP-binding cassette domain-containing protein n=1 Tax=Propionimicrobium sp. PCR01-08-3 TaxID=3052086 RepID=UPI00255C3696|nr:ATP-binding cassette domain-containing protein [Propionimicrobium sp. PCR01-08-3]WIY81960.1 ATP-binding cassette domain-containing protein [Propionimicrobium sp. PCR01-08-3]
MLQLESVTTGYGRVSVVFDVCLTVPDGKLVAVLGNNGAGKTTLLRAVMGLLPVRTGSVVFDGADITKLSTNKRVRRGIAYVPQGQQSFGQLTARENLVLIAERHGQAGARRMSEALDLFPALGGLLTRRAGLLSGGQRQQLAIARALITGPKLMVLDEPTEGIQPNVVAEIQAAISTMMSGAGISVLMVEQHVGYALEMADSFAVLASGRVMSTGAGGAAAVSQAREAMAL